MRVLVSGLNQIIGPELVMELATRFLPTIAGD